MAVLPYVNTGTRFIGKEGGKFTFNPQISAESQDNPLLMSEEELMNQISIAREIESQRGLKQVEAEQLANLLAALDFKQKQRASLESKTMEAIFGGGVPAGTVPLPSGVPAFDQKAYEDELAKSALAQREAIGQIFGARQKAGLQALEDIFGKQRGEAVEEQAALGSRLLSGAGQASIANVDAAKAKAIADFITSLESERGRAQLGIEAALPQQILAGRQFGTEAGLRQAGLGLQGAELGLREKLGRAGLLQSGSQFGQTLGLEKEKFSEQRRRTALEDLFNRESLEQAERLGRMQAEASEPSSLSQATEIVKSIGELAGGVGKLMGGFGAPKAVGDVLEEEKKKKKKKTGGEMI